MPPLTFPSLNKTNKLALAAATAATVGLCLCMVLRPNVLSKAPATVKPPVQVQMQVQKAPSAEDGPGVGDTIPTCERPAELAGVLPELLHGLAVADAGGPKGTYELVVWSHWPQSVAGAGPSRSQIMLVARDSKGKMRTVWKSEEEEGGYGPQIITEPDWKYNGHQVFLINRNMGAAMVVCQPVWVGNKTVHMLPDLGADFFRVTENGETHKHQLLGYDRSGDLCIERPRTYNWTGRDFAN
jgi:hypothetical protein